MSKGFEVGSEKYEQLSDSLESKIRLYISHFGMTKGENRYSNCNTVIILGDHFLPQKIYDDRGIYVKKDVTKADVIKSVAATTIQEIERSKSRLAQLSEPVACYLMCSDDVLAQIQNFFGLSNVVEIYQGELSGLRNADVYEELGKLTKSQKASLVKINQQFPGLFNGKDVLLNTTTVGEITGIRPNNVIRSLEGICKKTRFSLKTISSNQIGRKTGNMFELRLD